MGKYTICEEIGRGHFATVYRARDGKDGPDVAVKVINPALLDDPHFVGKFESGVCPTAHLSHPHIAPIYELGQVDGGLYMIAMQLLPGGSLAARLRKGPLPWAETLQVADEVGQALDYAYGQGMLHGDLRPANILFDTRGAAMVTDFALARASEVSQKGQTLANRWLS